MRLKSTTLKLLKTMDPNDVQNEKSCGQLTLELTYKPFKEEDMQKEGTEGTDMLEKAPDGTPAVQLVVACFMLLFMKVKITRGSTLQTHVQKNFPKARRRKQKVIKKNRDPQWEYEFEFVCEEPLVNDNHVEVLSKAPKKGLIHAKRRRKDVHWGAADVFFRMHTWLLTCRYLIPFSPGFWAQLPIWLFFQGRAPQGIRLYFLPRGMARREQNRSRHNHRKDCIYWTLEWKFNSTDVVLTDHEIDEHTTLLSLLEKHLCPGPWKDQLTQYRNTELRDLKLFIQKSAKESESPYRLLNIEEPLRPQLRGLLVVEYPTIKVFLPSDSYDFEVEKMANKLAKDGKTTGSTTDGPPVEGNKFHEEEIEEGEFSPETEVIDLKDCGPSSASKLASAEVTCKSRRDNNVDSSLLSYPGSQAVHGQEKELNRYGKTSSNGSSGRTETKSRIEACPQGMEKAREGELCSSGHIADLKEQAGVAALSKIDCMTDSLVPSSINILAPDGATGPQQEQSQQSRRTPSSTPEALKKKSLMKVYPLDFDDSNGGLLLEVPDLAFEQEMMDTYPELFGDMDVDDFLSCDFETMTADESAEAMSGLLWDDLEEGEIPTM